MFYRNDFGSIKKEFIFPPDHILRIVCFFDFIILNMPLSGDKEVLEAYVEKVLPLLTPLFGEEASKAAFTRFQEMSIEDISDLEWANKEVDSKRVIGEWKYISPVDDLFSYPLKTDAVFPLDDGRYIRYKKVIRFFKENRMYVYLARKKGKKVDYFDGLFFCKPSPNEDPKEFSSVDEEEIPSLLELITPLLTRLSQAKQ